MENNFIKEYMLSKFGSNYKISSNGEEFIFPSPFLSQNIYKKYCSINLKTGLWQDFKTGEKGNFVTLYSILENVSYQVARVKVGGLLSYSPKTISVAELGEDLNEIISTFEPVSIYEEPKTSIQSMAWLYLDSRKLLDERFNFYVCKEGLYANRLIIPYFDNNNLFFFQGRSLINKEPKYLNYQGVKKAHILYPFNYADSRVVVCEGPLDSISLQIAGVNSTCIMGCNVSYPQMKALKNFPGKIILGFDNDKAGQDGVLKFDKIRRELRISEFYICTPPKKVKDWNEALVKKIELKEYFNSFTKKFDKEEFMLNFS